MLQDVLRQYWGYNDFRPLQREAMTCVIEHHDSVVVLPTGGGKSLCFQAPAMCLPGMAVVVSPLISLMKDQVDTLRQCGISAAYINSTLSPTERRILAQEIRAGQIKLLYIAPERLVQPHTIEFLKTANVSLLAIDEAHCISEWGHDFRPEYRELKLLKEHFPKIGVHAYTATATERVRLDIADQLGLANPKVLVGSFDRPNLIYRVQRRASLMTQIQQVLKRHKRESGIIYCISRNEVETTSTALNELGFRTLPYHAGMTDEQRHKHQEKFIAEKIDIIVATVAFGMGIDKSNVRFVVHAGMPKSLEAYQQESGRAGRDGLPAECCLFYSGNDLYRWKKMLEGSEPAQLAAATLTLEAMANFCGSAVCRHQSLVRYFGQELASDACEACDVCLGEVDLATDALIIGQKILSCVLRQQERFGGEYTSLVLKGSKDQRISQNGHDKLSTFGILAEESQRTIRDWIEQLVGQGFLAKTGDYNVLGVTPAGRQLLRGEVTPRLLKPNDQSNRKDKAHRGASGVRRSVETDSWVGVDEGLFEDLRVLRREIALEFNVPPYIVFSDEALRDMARQRPSNLDNFAKIKGVGAKKLAEYGDDFVARIIAYCQARQLPMNLVSVSQFSAK